MTGVLPGGGIAQTVAADVFGAVLVVVVVMAVVVARIAYVRAPEIMLEMGRVPNAA